VSALESIQRSRMLVRRLCAKMRVPHQDFEDVTQDAAIDVLRYGNGNASVHAHRVTVEHLRTELGRRGDRFALRFYEDEGVVVSAPLDTDAIDLHLLLDRMPMRDREVLVLRLMVYELAEIADSFDRSPAWACIELKRITRQLRESVEAGAS